jgi:hypothetical protein
MDERLIIRVDLYLVILNLLGTLVLACMIDGQG